MNLFLSFCWNASFLLRQLGKQVFFANVTGTCFMSLHSEALCCDGSYESQNLLRNEQTMHLCLNNTNAELFCTTHILFLRWALLQTMYHCLSSQNENPTCTQIQCYTVYFINLPAEAVAHHENVGLLS